MASIEDTVISCLEAWKQCVNISTTIIFLETTYWLPAWNTLPCLTPRCVTMLVVLCLSVDDLEEKLQI